MKRATTILLMLCSFMFACSDIRSEPVEYTADNVVLQGYLAYDNSITGKRPGLLVVHEWWGHN
ncbi:MAG: dienelactone hydrolase family protein, partial [Thermodesulfovibrionia bacterium]|nr:dienelactone hydrolase family protein [Thermodesulfovibrionia bacterium]